MKMNASPNHEELLGVVPTIHLEPWSSTTLFSKAQMENVCEPNSECVVEKDNGKMVSIINYSELESNQRKPTKGSGPIWRCNCGGENEKN